MTQREFYTLILNGTGTSTDTVDGKKVSTAVSLYDETGALSAEVINYAKAAISALDEKNAKRKTSKAETDRKAANSALAEGILTSLEKGRTYTASELAKTFGVSTQKISAIIKPLAENGSITVIEGYKPEGAKSKVKGYALPTEG